MDSHILLFKMKSEASNILGFNPPVKSIQLLTQNLLIGDQFH